MVAALNQQLESSRHSAAFVINRHLFFIAKRAYELTPVAKRQHILETFNVTQRERVVKKGKHIGKIRRTTNYSGVTRSAYRIMNWKRKQKGLPGAARADALRLVKKMIAGRLRAIGTLRSGWVGAIVKLKEALNEAFEPYIRNVVKQRGTARLARPESKNPTGQIAYRIAVKKKSGEQIDPRVIQALQQAFDAEAADTLRHLSEVLQEGADKVNVR